MWFIYLMTDRYNCDHYSSFVGICIEDNQVQILTEYCTKGSLSDVMENDALKLDWPFRFSLTNDLISVKGHGPKFVQFIPFIPFKIRDKRRFLRELVCIDMICVWYFSQGMSYLHESPIESHGNLTSSNCVIDSRFVLKVTDYGLAFLQQFVNTKDGDNKSDYFRLLWRAPEHLRALMPPKGTKLGTDKNLHWLIDWLSCRYRMN